MSTAKQRIIVLAGLVVLLIAAPIVNYAFNNSKPTSASKSQKPSTTAAASTTDNGSVMTGSFFTDYVTQRDKQRNDEVKYLDGIISNTKTDADTLKTAQQKKTEITSSMEKELSVESLLKAKGFTRVAAVYHPGSLNVIVGKAQLTDAEVAQILDVATKETKEPAANIKVIPVQ